MNSPLCNRCRKQCKQLLGARIVRCPQFQEKGGEKSEKVNCRDNKENATGAGRPAPAANNSEEGEEK